jgi:hypothetical protein
MNEFAFVLQREIKSGFLSCDALCPDKSAMTLDDPGHNHEA